jgi:hypothetical protein
MTQERKTRPAPIDSLRPDARRMKARPEPPRCREDIVQGEAAKLADTLNANA